MEHENRIPVHDAAEQRAQRLHISPNLAAIQILDAQITHQESRGYSPLPTPDLPELVSGITNTKIPGKSCET